MVYNSPVGVADVSSVAYLLPVFVFVVVGVVLFALLRKFKMLGDVPFLDLVVSIIIAAVFVVTPSVRDMVIIVIPWFAVLIMAMFCILLLVNFIGKTDLAGRGLGIIFVVLVFVIFILAGARIFASSIFPYLPGPSFGSGNSDPQTLFFLSWLYSPRIAGAFWLILTAIGVSWALLKYGK